MTSFPVPANRPWFNSRARLVTVPALSAPYQLRISLTRGVIVALLVAFAQQNLQVILGMGDKQLFSAILRWHTSELYPRRLHRDEHGAPRRECRRLLQQARHEGEADQDRHEGCHMWTALHGKHFFGASNDLVGCGHMSGLCRCGAYVRGPDEVRRPGSL